MSEQYQKDVVFLQDGGCKCKVFYGKTEFIRALTFKVCKKKNEFVDRIDKSIP